ncbi:hypothetical protein [Stakelama pacifica]|uniref:Uncharacterized protein n=1 Tax=Stakelama pacifica TaxID=517720 RepID=A0A4R6FN41_9SPHN|nr:hypothetical protein [Stakelama pacifica]TDN83021.1 hypothetical protein EV664_105219 [Stakelama pacifica]GGO94909.1 hypothetical protein GCM10011329_17850 [Stakelama pacifica]
MITKELGALPETAEEYANFLKGELEKIASDYAPRIARAHASVADADSRHRDGAEPERHHLAHLYESYELARRPIIDQLILLESRRPYRLIMTAERIDSPDYVARATKNMSHGDGTNPLDRSKTGR